MAKRRSAPRLADFLRLLWCALLVGAPPGAAAQPFGPLASAPRAELAARQNQPAAARAAGRLRAAQLGLVINSADPYSVAVGDYYIEKRQLLASQILRVELPTQDQLSAEAFEVLRGEIARAFGPQIQALALAWNAPFAVDCLSITGALALGLNPALCASSCRRGRASPYFNASTARPFTELGMRPSMLIAAATVAEARQLIDRGVASDGSAGLRGAPPAVALYVATADAARNVRAPYFPPPGLISASGLLVKHIDLAQLPRQRDLLLVQIGIAQVPAMDTLHWRPGALADHLTSFGGLLSREDGQTTALQWIRAGATASYGTVSEPCNHVQKFPHPRLLLQHYLQGQTALEAYWKSVAWPEQGVFVGEPLAAPFSRSR